MNIKRKCPQLTKKVFVQNRATKKENNTYNIMIFLLITAITALRINAIKVCNHNRDYNNKNIGNNKIDGNISNSNTYSKPAANIPK